MRASQDLKRHKPIQVHTYISYGHSSLIHSTSAFNYLDYLHTVRVKSRKILAGCHPFDKELIPLLHRVRSTSPKWQDNFIVAPKICP